MELPPKWLKGSNAADNRGGQVHSLYTAPILQKSPNANLEIMHSKASEFSSAPNFQDHNKTMILPKDENKEGAGYRLLNMLRKTLKGSESKELEITPEVPTLIPFGDVVGCLAVHIKNCRHFTPRISLHYSNLFIRISINNIVKCTKMCSLLSRNDEKNTTINFDDIKYFSVQVPRRQDDERNNIYLELMQYKNTEKYPLFLGSVQVHLYDVIQKGCFIEEFEMLNKSTLKPLQKIIEPSMFMNIAPPPERIDPVTNVITPQPIEYPAFLSPDLNVTVGMPAVVPQSNQPSVVRLEKLQQQPRERLEKMKKEYRNLNTWIEKASYLEGVLTPKLAHSEHKEIDTNQLLKSLHEEESEVFETSDVPFIMEEAETVPSELPGNDDKRSMTLPTLNQSNQDNSDAVAPESDESTKQTDESTKQTVESTKQIDESTKQTPLPVIPIPTITEENKTSPLEEYQSKAVPEGKMKNMFFPPEVKLKDRYPSLLKTDSSPSELLFLFPVAWRQQEESPYCSISTMNENIDLPNTVERVMQDQLYGQKNTNKKGKSVIFSPKEHILPAFRPQYIEFKPKYQFQKFNFKDGSDPFLRNINKMSVRKRKDQDLSKCRNTLSAEVIEHEDQDPPYPTYSKTARPTNKTWPCDPGITTVKTLDTKTKLKSACDPDFITVKTLNMKNNVARDPNMTTIETLDTKNNLKERLPNVSLPNFEGESSVTGNINTYHLSKSLSLTSHLENLKQSMMLKSILSKNLQDLSDKLFSKPEVPMDTEARKKSHSSPLLRVHDEPPSSLENKVCEKVQDLNNCLPEKDIVSSKSLLKRIIKDIPADSLSEGGPRNSPEVETALVSEKHLEAGEINFPIKKNNFKQKHSNIEVSSSKPGISDTANDYVLKQIFTAPIFSELEIGVKELSETPVNLQNQLPTAWESLSSNILLHYEENNDEIELPQAKSVISQIIQAFPVDTLLESGIIKVIELDKQYQKSSVLDTETVFAEEEPKYSTEDYSETQSRTESLSEQNTLIIPKETTSSFNGVEYMDEGQNVTLQDSKYQSTPDKKADMLSNSQRSDREENDLNSTLENLSNSLMGKLNDSDVIMLKSFLKHMFNIFFKYNQSERKQPEKELERLIQHPFPNNTEDLEEIKKNFDKIDKLDRKPILSSKLRVFLEELSESEIKNLKSELSKHIQHYLVERLSESGHITKEDLPKIYQNLYLMNEKVEPKRQNIFLEKYSETVKEVMSFVNNFNHHFIDKHLEIKLRSFLNEILQNYFLKNLSESSLFKETESETIDSNMSSLRTKSASISFCELGQDISRGNFGKRLDLNMKYPLNKSLQNYLIALSENELLNLKADLSKHLQSLFIEKLSKSGLITERQLEGINQHINLINSSSIPFKCIKPDLSFRNENQFMEENSEKQNKYSKIVQKTTLQKIPEDRLIETELTKKEEKEYFPLQNIKENPSIIEEQKRYYPKEEAKTLRLIKVQPSFIKNTQVIPLNKSSERVTDIVLKQRKEHGFIQLPRAENYDFKTEIQDPHSWSGKSKTTQSNIYFERTLKAKPLEKREHNIYKLMAQEKPEAVLSPYPRIPNCKMPSENEYIYKYTFPSRQNNTLTHFNLEAGEKLKLEDQYIERLKGNNNNNKKHLVTFAQYKKIHTLSVKTNGICNEKYAKFPESQSFKYKVVEAEKNSKPSLFPEVLKRENLKPKVRKERDHVNKQKKSFSKIVKILPATLPTARILRKSVPRTLLHWTARRTIHDCSDRFEDIPVTSFKHAEQAKSRTRLLGKSPDDSHNQLKHFSRPNTAPEVHKRRENYSGKFTSPRMVSAGLVHINDAIPDYEIHKMRQKRKLKENIEVFAHL
ncbi:C2 calcium-dependent domain-containing protein 6 isoform X3 [Zalophus californianus]|uniref:C2 calcium-dependent domain-containing protein 6 isoform X3 n=1 Tax=Zalophus californianus TaxID=9704 RepID=A0A6J2CUY6_ZALCA|nr:C2 calcium-dependent domain-containing protein 6 isoform X3 [Zalophus californianus]